MTDRKYKSGYLESEKKIERMLERAGADEGSVMSDAHDGEAFARWTVNGEKHEVRHTVEASQALDTEDRDLRVDNTLDIYAQLAEAVTRLSYAIRMGVFSWDRELQGLALPAPSEGVPECFRRLGFDEVVSAEQVKAEAKRMRKMFHPDGFQEPAKREVADNYTKNIGDWEQRCLDYLEGNNG